MDAIWLGLSPSTSSTRILGMRGPGKTILKAHLSPRPSSSRAITTLFEALALWEGLPVRAALVVDEWSTSTCPPTLYQDLFDVFGESTSLYQLEWVPRAVRRKRDGLTGLGDFSDLARVLARSVAR